MFTIWLFRELKDFNEQNLAIDFHVAIVKLRSLSWDTTGSPSHFHS